MKPLPTTLCALILLALAGCQSTGFLMGKPDTRMLVPAGPPTPADRPIEVHFYEAPAAAYEEMAYIDITDTSKGWCVSEIRRVAREIGADGVIFIAKAHGFGWTAAEVDANRRLTEEEKLEKLPAGHLSAVAFRYRGVGEGPDSDRDD